MDRIHHILQCRQDERNKTPAIIDYDGREISYGTLYEACAEASALLRSHGVQCGDRVLILAENSFSEIVFILACSMIDAFALPLNALLKPAEIDRVITHAEPRAIIYTSKASRPAHDHSQRQNAITCTGRYGTIALATPYPSAPEIFDVSHDISQHKISQHKSGDDVAVILYTTGTTGAPKGVMLTHNNFLYASKISAAQRGMGPGDIIYGALPITHVFGLASVMLATLYAGATIMVQKRFSAEALYHALQQDVSILPAVPQMHALLMHYAREHGVSKLEGGRLKFVSSGAAPLDPTWKQKAENFYGIALQNGYGMTEATAGVSLTHNEIGNGDISVGLPLEGVEIILDTKAGDEDRAHQAQDAVGEILIRGPNVMKGYFRLPQETAQALDERGFLHTGDLGRFDAQGNLHIVGRSKELIIRSGFNVYPQEVEAALNQHRDVVQSAVIGRKNADGNEDVLAFVQVSQRGGVSEDELKDHVARLLANYKCPQRIITAARLPAAATGKILKHKLLDTFQRELAQS